MTLKEKVYKPVHYCCWYMPQYWLLSLMCNLGITVAYMMRTSLNIAITVMSTHGHSGNLTPDPQGCNATLAASNRTVLTPEFEWSEQQQGLLLSSFYWGYALCNLPGGYLATRFGGKYVMSIGIFITAILELVAPVLTKEVGGYGALLVIRILQGIVQGPIFPSVSVLLSQWSPPGRKSLLASISYSGNLVGNIIGYSTAGFVLQATDHNWAALFYIFGGLGLVWVLLFWLFCFSTPDHHPYLGPKEKVFLTEQLAGVKHGKAVRKVPWKAILTSVPFWGLMVGQVGHAWIYFAVVTDLPKYMNSVLKFNVKNSGVYSALPFAAELLVSLGSGWLADKIIAKKWLSTTNTRKLFVTISSTGPSIMMVGAIYIGCNRPGAVAALTVGMALMGTFFSGIKVNSQDLSPNFTGILMALVNGAGGVAGILVPYIIGVMIPYSHWNEWMHVFWMIAAVTIATNIVFVLTASGDVQPWNEVAPQAPTPPTPPAPAEQ